MEFPVLSLLHFVTQGEAGLPASTKASAGYTSRPSRPKKPHLRLLLSCQVSNLNSSDPESFKNKIVLSEHIDYQY
jgi:hypothetical protein